jgi:hypothetical protein
MLVFFRTVYSFHDLDSELDPRTQKKPTNHGQSLRETAVETSGYSVHIPVFSHKPPLENNTRSRNK